MSKKIVLTVEQDKAIEALKHIQRNMQENERNGHLIKEKSRGGWISENFKAANAIPFENFVDALIKGYEVQPEFKVNDSVVHTKGAFKGVKTVTHLNVRGYVFVDDVLDVGYSPSNVRHSTKEEAFWDELGREVGEFREFDVVVENDKMTHLIGEYKEELNDDLEFAKKYYAKELLKGFYPAESFIKFPK